MISNDGIAKILDFGVVKIPGQAKLTRIGSFVGSLAYLSPEQTSGGKADARSDIWSLGILIYEMLTKKSPFGGEYEVAIIYSILNEEPEKITSLRPDVPLALNHIVDWAITKNLEQRYQHVDELLVYLLTIKQDFISGKSTSRFRTPRYQPIKRFYPYVAIFALFVVPFSAALYLLSRHSETINSHAVLPLVDASVDPNVDYLSDGITESLINSFSQLPKLQVIARTTVFGYKGTAENPREIGHKLNVSAVLTGKVVQQNDIFIIQMDLVDDKNGIQLWSERYNKKLNDVFAIQDDIAMQISEKLRIRLGGKERTKLTKNYTKNTTAYQLYLKGRY